jgi:hypothetical protein
MSQTTLSQPTTITQRRPRRAALLMTSEEADAILDVLISARPSEAASSRVAEHLLCRIARVRRSLISGGERRGGPARRLQRRARR